MQELFSALSLWLSAHPLITGWYTAIARLLFPVLSALILVRAIRSLLRIPHTPEVWAQLSLPGGGSIPLPYCIVHMILPVSFCVSASPLL